MEITEYIAAIERDGRLLADAAVVAGLSASVPACPGWQVRDLVRHQAYVHAWAARHIAERAATVIEAADEKAVLGGGPPDDELIPAYRAGLSGLVRTLRDADPDVQCATFLPAPSPLAFWARRQAHETAVHRFDAQSAGGDADVVAACHPAFAADGIDELVMGFAARRKRAGAGNKLVVRVNNAPAAWTYEWPADGRVVARRISPGAGEPADCVLSGPACGLYLFLWNRCTAEEAGAAITGDPAILRAWNSDVRVRWS